MPDPVLNLSVAVHGGKGIYALLLGSGVSRSSGVPTGWEVVQDLIRKIARVKGEDCGGQPDEWFRRTFGSEPGYSEILSQLTGTPTERSQLLRAYFEPSADELEQGQKQPTEAHARIAELVSKGYVRVIITTNFDRLLEQALERVGIGATIIASPDAVDGAIPLAHSPCTVIKVHGDYLDTRLKNTVDELEEYDPAVEQLLDRVFDDYGLIICGWSGDWDTALGNSILRCRSRRFTTYWTMLEGTTPGDRAASLVKFRKASVVEISSADTFFRRLAENLTALETMAPADPISGDVAVAQLKRYLPADDKRIAFHDLLQTEIRRTQEQLHGGQFPLNAQTRAFGAAELMARISAYDSKTATLVRLAAVTAYWARPDQFGILVSILKELSEVNPLVSGTVVLISLRLYPALLLFYAIGVAAVASSNFSLLKEVLTAEIVRDPNKQPEPAAITLNDNRCLPRDSQRELPGYERQFTALLNHMAEILKEATRDLLLSPARFDDCLDRFDYIRTLVAWDSSVTRAEVLELRKENKPLPRLGIPAGRYAWKDSFYGENGLPQRMAIKNGVIPPEVAALLATDLFESGQGRLSDKYQMAKEAVDAAASRHREQWI